MSSWLIIKYDYDNIKLHSDNIKLGINNDVDHGDDDDDNKLTIIYPQVIQSTKEYDDKTEKTYTSHKPKGHQ